MANISFIICIESGFSLDARRNYMVYSGASGSATTLYGIESSGGLDPNILLHNNVIVGASSSSSNGTIYLRTASNAVIQNNTIIGGDTGDTYGIYLTGGLLANAGKILNNIIYMQNGGTSTGIYYGNAANIATISNNNIFGANVLVHDETGGAPGIDAVTLHDTFDISSGTVTLASLNNVSVDMVSGGWMIISSDSNFGKIKGTPPASIIIGGEDLSGAPTPLTDDLEGTIRTGDGKGGYTMGAYEYEGNYTWTDPLQFTSMQVERRIQAAKGFGSSPTYQQLPSIGAGGNDWVGAVLAKNGKIYFIPHDNQFILVFNPSNGDTYTIDTGIISASKWFGGVLGPDDKIYGIPHGESNILIIDPSNDTFVLEPLTGDPSSIAVTNGRFAGGVLAPNGKIYAIPHNHDHVLEIDPSGPALSWIPHLQGQNNALFIGGVLAGNGMIYAIPYNHTEVYKINPYDLSLTSIPFLSGAGQEFSGGILGYDGNIYAVPYFTDDVLVIDPSTDTASLSGLGTPAINEKWMGGAVSPGGHAFFTPHDLDSIGILYTDGSALSPIAGLPGTGNKWVGMIAVPGGKMYASPFNETSILEITHGAAGTWPEKFYYSAYFNKY